MENIQGDWDNVSDIARDFGFDLSDSIEIVFGAYTHAWSGYAFVLYRENGKLYEVNGSHCSCYGLEGQWEPEETSVEALQHRVTNGYCHDFVKEAMKFL